MSYSLRAENARRKPQRFRSPESEEEMTPRSQEQSQGRRNRAPLQEDLREGVDTSSSSLNMLPPSPQPHTPLPLTRPAPTVNSQALSRQPTRREGLSKSFKEASMSHTKKFAPPKSSPQRAPIHRKAEHSARPPRERPTSVYAKHPNPLSYPSGSFNNPSYATLDEDGPVSHYTIRQRIDGVGRGCQKSHNEAVAKMNAAYAGIISQSMQENQKEWYRKLEKMWHPLEGNIRISFMLLDNTLQITIIESIADSVPPNLVNTKYDIALRVVNINRSQWAGVQRKNSEIFWNGIPKHLLELKRAAKPGEPVNADTPPQGDILKAMRWLKQESLPCSLLGEWQKMPESWCFLPVFAMVDHNQDESQDTSIYYSKSDRQRRHSRPKYHDNNPSLHPSGPSAPSLSAYPSRHRSTPLSSISGNSRSAPRQPLVSTPSQAEPDHDHGIGKQYDKPIQAQNTSPLPISPCLFERPRERARTDSLAPRSLTIKSASYARDKPQQPHNTCTSLVLYSAQFHGGLTFRHADSHPLSIASVKHRRLCREMERRHRKKIVEAQRVKLHRGINKKATHIEQMMLDNGHNNATWIGLKGADGVRRKGRCPPKRPGHEEVPWRGWNVEVEDLALELTPSPFRSGLDRDSIGGAVRSEYEEERALNETAHDVYRRDLVDHGDGLLSGTSDHGFRPFGRVQDDGSIQEEDKQDQDEPMDMGCEKSRYELDSEKLDENINRDFAELEEVRQRAYKTKRVDMHEEDDEANVEYGAMVLGADDIGFGWADVDFA